MSCSKSWMVPELAKPAINNMLMPTKAVKTIAATLESAFAAVWVTVFIIVSFSRLPRRRSYVQAMAGLLACGMKRAAFPGKAQWHDGAQTHLQSRGRLLLSGLVWSPVTAFPFHPRAFSHIGEPLPFERCTELAELSNKIARVRYLRANNGFRKND